MRIFYVGSKYSPRDLLRTIYRILVLLYSSIWLAIVLFIVGLGLRESKIEQWPLPEKASYSLTRYVPGKVNLQLRFSNLSDLKDALYYWKE
jgi:hypothetical protein